MTQSLDQLPRPTHKNDTSWSQAAQKAEAELLEIMRREYATPEGRKKIDRMVAELIEQWTYPGQYPEGLSPEIWQSMQANATTPQTFFTTVDKHNHMDGVTKNLWNMPYLWRLEMGLSGKSDKFDQYVDSVKLFTAFYVAGEKYLGKPPGMNYP